MPLRFLRLQISISRGYGTVSFCNTGLRQRNHILMTRIFQKSGCRKQEYIAQWKYTREVSRCKFTTTHLYNKGYGEIHLAHISQPSTVYMVHTEWVYSQKSWKRLRVWSCELGSSGLLKYHVMSNWYELLNLSVELGWRSDISYAQLGLWLPRCD